MDHVKKFLNVEGTIGQGAFGRVLATTNSPKSRFALKCIHPILRPQRLANELRHLRDLGGQFNVVQMHTAHLDKGSLYIVMELIEHDRFSDIVAQLDLGEIVMYMKNLLIALKHVHSHNIIHRDIKPANFLYNRREKKFLLVDFGLAQNVNLKYNHRIPTLGTQSPATKISNSTLMTSIPTTPTRTLQFQTATTATARRLIAPTTQDSSAKNQITTLVQPIVNMSSHRLHKSPSRHSINLTTTLGSPITPNLSAKRHFPESDHFNHDFKKLRVTGADEVKEPVRLTVGAYESPITNNNENNNIFTPTRRSSGNFPTFSDHLQRNKQQHKFSTPTIPSRRLPPRRYCGCPGKAKSCSICMNRPDNNAPKSGTPGYKAPEILIRYANQSTAIDMWSSGVIFASLLCGHTPFFRDVDDITSLSEVITLLGSQRVGVAAKSLGIRLSIHPKVEPVMDLRSICLHIRQMGKSKLQLVIPDEAFDLLSRMLDPNPNTRISAADALEHPWLASN